MEPENWMELLPKRKSDSHKGTYGKVLVAAGSKNMCGASYLAGLAAYRAGAGLVYLLAPECNRVILQTLLPEAVLITYDPGDCSKAEVLNALEGKDAVVAGPGLGASPAARQIVAAVLESEKTKRILDADALNLLAADPELWDCLVGRVIVTPHMAEMHRLCGIPLEELKADPEKAAGRLSRERGIITVLKDAQTVISDGRRTCRNRTGNHGMATGGSGDVLSGVIGALLGQGMELYEAACLGVYLHGMAGDAARQKRGAYSMMARDIAEHILYGVS